MEKTIIAVWGVSDKGKTTAIRLAYEDLRAQFPSLNPGRRALKEVRGAILDINGVKVGFESSGDKPEILEENIPPLIDAECLVIVCATHTRRSRTVDVVERLAAQHGYEIEWVEKPGDQDHEAGNRQKADEIIAKVHLAVERARLVEA